MSEELQGEADSTPQVEQVNAPPSRRRLAFMSTVLALLLAALGFVRLDSSRNATALAEAAKGKIEEHTAPIGDAPALDTATVVTVSRDSILWGKATGKVSVFIRDGNDYAGIDYFYELNDGNWLLTDSGSCTSAECRVRAKEAFGD